MVNEQLTEKNHLIEKLQIEVKNMNQKSLIHNDQHDDSSKAIIDGNLEELTHKQNEIVNLFYSFSSLIFLRLKI